MHGLALAPAPRRARDLLQRTSFPVHPFDQMHGVDTSGLVPAKHLVTGHANDEHITAYYGVAPSILRALIGAWRASGPPHPIEDYIFIDVGAGKGRALLVASEYSFRKVAGIELNPEMAAIARQNVEHWTRAHREDPTAARLAPIEVVEQDALDFELPQTPTLLFLFHPFEAPVLKQLLRRIETQFARRPGTLDLLYVNAECANVIDRNPGIHAALPGERPHVAGGPCRRPGSHRAAEGVRLHGRRRVRHLSLYGPREGADLHARGVGLLLQAHDQAALVALAVLHVDLAGGALHDALEALAPLHQKQRIRVARHLVDAEHGDLLLRLQAIEVEMKEPHGCARRIHARW